MFLVSPQSNAGGEDTCYIVQLKEATLFCPECLEGVIHKVLGSVIKPEDERYREIIARRKIFLSSFPSLNPIIEVLITEVRCADCTRMCEFSLICSLLKVKIIRRNLWVMSPLAGGPTPILGFSTQILRL